jgi:dTDP-glucose 4,6-dehydratase
MDFWKGKNVLVTGASGFTGSHLCRALINSGANVRAYIKRGSSLFNLSDIINKVQIARGDITDLTNLFNVMKDIKYVFHVAAIVPVAESRDLPYSSFQVNSLGVFNVAWAATKNNVKRILYTSTCHVYGNQPDDKIPIKEDTQPNPVDTYSASKYAGEILLRPLINQSDGLEIIITRAFNKYGPYQVGDWLIPRTIKQVLNKQNPKLGNPDSTRDYTFIEDAVTGYMATMEFGEHGEIYNLPSGIETSVKDVVEKIIDISGISVNPVWDTSYRKFDVRRSCGDGSKAKLKLGWETKISFEEGLKLTINWWKEHPELLKF